MGILYCPECSNYLMGGDGEYHDCSCGWKQKREIPENWINDELSEVEMTMLDSFGYSYHRL